jgi:hypothetical protein
MKKITYLIFISLLLSWTSEESLISLLTQKLNDFNKTNPCNQLHLVFNQNKYAPGDTAFFSAYFVSEDFLPIKGRKVLPLALFNHDGQQEQYINFEVMDGKGHNQIVVPNSALAGQSQLVVRSLLSDQTNYVDLFSEEIIIVEKNTVVPLVKKPENSISVFPEGGNIIGSVENNLIVKSNFRGPHRIINAKNERIADFSVDQTGYAKINFTPQGDGEYYVEADGQAGKFSIEKAKEEGCALQLKIPSEGPVIARLTVPSQKQRELYVVIVGRRKIVFSVVANFSDTHTSQISIPRENLPDGLNQLTVFDKSGTILADRIFFIRRNGVSATITLPNNALGQRERIDVETLLQDSYGNPLSGNLILSVVQKKFFTAREVMSFHDELMLSSISILKRDILTACTTSEEFSAALDNILTASPEKIIPWKELLAGNKIPRPVIKTSLSLKGKAIFKSSGSPVPDSTLLAGYLQNNMMGYETYTNKEGKFELKFLLNFWGEDELFYLMEKGRSLGEDYMLIPDKSIVQEPLSHQVSLLKDSMDRYADYQSKKKMVSQSYKFFSGNQNKIATFKDLNAQFEDEAEGADFNVNVQDYVVFPTMEDVIREVIPYLEYRKKNNTIRLLLPQVNGNLRPKSEPLFVIDGVLTKNKNIFLGLKPGDIVSIKLINNPNKLSKWGVLGKNGIVLVTTKNTSASTILERGSLIKVTGLSRPIEFVSPDYSKTNNTRTPDLRSTLSWTPAINVNSDGKANLSFYTSDDIGTFEIRVKGLSSQGKPFEAIRSFEVTFKE